MAHNFKLQDTQLLCPTGWINGKAAKSVTGRKPFPVHDPATDEVWAHVENMDEKDTELAITAATDAFQAFSLTPARQRARMLVELDRLFRAAKGDIAQLIVMESGKALAEAEAEVEYAGKSLTELD